MRLHDASKEMAASSPLDFDHMAYSMQPHSHLDLTGGLLEDGCSS